MSTYAVSFTVPYFNDAVKATFTPEPLGGVLTLYTPQGVYATNTSEACIVHGTADIVYMNRDAVKPDVMPENCVEHIRAWLRDGYELAHHHDRLHVRTQLGVSGFYRVWTLNACSPPWIMYGPLCLEDRLIYGEPALLLNSTWGAACVSLEDRMAFIPCSDKLRELMYECPKSRYLSLEPPTLKLDDAACMAELKACLVGTRYPDIVVAMRRRVVEAHRETPAPKAEAEPTPAPKAEAEPTPAPKAEAEPTPAPKPEAEPTPDADTDSDDFELVD
jgi:hypothetical protein